MDRHSPIGVFDSGIGGISVLAELKRKMPNEDYIYYGDTKNAPYGTKTQSEIMALAEQVAGFLITQDVKAIVIACNTATAAVAKELRARYTIPIIGMEPALKLAYDTVGSEAKIAVLATPAAMKSEKYRHLESLYGKNAVSLPCGGLMEFAERLEMDSPGLHAYLDHVFTDSVKQDLKAVVLGCTHYVFLKKAVQKHTDAIVLDGNAGTARQLKRRLEETDTLEDRQKEGKITMYSSAGDDSVKIMQTLFKESIAI